MITELYPELDKLLSRTITDVAESVVTVLGAGSRLNMEILIENSGGKISDLTEASEVIPGEHGEKYGVCASDDSDFCILIDSKIRDKKERELVLARAYGAYLLFFADESGKVSSKNVQRYRRLHYKLDEICAFFAAEFFRINVSADPDLPKSNGGKVLIYGNIVRGSEILRNRIGIFRRANDVLQKHGDESAYLFISIDLTNSTKFKLKSPQLWQRIIISFYDCVFDAFGIGGDKKPFTDPLYSNPERAEKLKDCRFMLWKLVGDEVLIYLKLDSRSVIKEVLSGTEDFVNALPQLLCDAENASHRSAEEMFTATNGYKIGNEFDWRLSEFKSDIAIRSLLGGKVTAWIALCGEPNTNTRNVRYDFLQNRLGDNSESVNSGCDFLGPEIDEGFRLSKFAVRSRVLVSPILAGLISTVEGNENGGNLVDNSVKIISYQQLKGVWDDAQYPVILYSYRMKDLYDIARYDELDMPVYKHIPYNANYMENFYNNPAYNSVQINTILKNVNMYPELNRIKKMVK